MTATERIEAAARRGAAYLLMLVLFVLNVIASPYPLSLLLGAPFTLMALYYWSIHRPAMVPVWLCFIAGLLIDILGGYPAGFHALLFIGLRWFLKGRRRFLLAQGFVIFWMGFAVLCAGVYAVLWLVTSLAALQLVPLLGIYPPLIMGVLLFPLISAFLSLTHKIL